MMRQYYEKWDQADAYADHVADTVARAICCAGRTPFEIGGEVLEDAVVRREYPLRLSQLAQVAVALGAGAAEAKEWLAKANHYAS